MRRRDVGAAAGDPAVAGSRDGVAHHEIEEAGVRADRTARRDRAGGGPAVIRRPSGRSDLTNSSAFSSRTESISSRISSISSLSFSPLEAELDLAGVLVVRVAAGTASGSSSAPAPGGTTADSPRFGWIRHSSRGRAHAPREPATAFSSSTSVRGVGRPVSGGPPRGRVVPRSGSRIGTRWSASRPGVEDDRVPRRRRDRVRVLGDAAPAEVRARVLGRLHDARSTSSSVTSRSTLPGGGEPVVQALGRAGRRGTAGRSAGAWGRSSRARPARGSRRAAGTSPPSRARGAAASGRPRAP